MEKVKIFAFDSFEGLPEERDDGDLHHQWGKGVFTSDYESVKHEIKKFSRDHHFPFENIIFIKGFFLKH